jgi:hypothetical protein
MAIYSKMSDVEQLRLLRFFFIFSIFHPYLSRESLDLFRVNGLKGREAEKRACSMLFSDFDGKNIRGTVKHLYVTSFSITFFP